MTLVEFLTARLDEDEGAAKAATPGPWTTREGREWLADNVVYGEGSWPGHIQQAANVDYAEHKAGNAAHIARHDPARVLRDVEAKRKILAEYERLHAERKAHPHDLAQAGALLALLGVIRGLAAVYSDHPDLHLAG